MTRGSRGAPPLVFTIGHSLRGFDEFLALLRAHGITRLADVRTIPRSRRNPQFDRAALPAALGGAGVAYVHLPALGGLRTPRPDSRNAGWRNAGFRGYADHMATAAFEDAVTALLETAASERTAVMCAEAVPWRCHRSLLSDAFVVRGASVRHILSPTSAPEHVVTPWARVDGTRITYANDAGAQRELPGTREQTSPPPGRRRRRSS